MQAAALDSHPVPLLSAIARFAVAAAVGVVLTAVWVLAGSESHHAVDASSAAMSPPNVSFVKLPTIEIVGKRVARPSAA